MTNVRRLLKSTWLLNALLISVPLAPAQTASAAQTNIAGPAGSVLFGASVALLPNGNIVVADPRWATGSAQEWGAVYLYTSKGQLISTLTGSSDLDHVGTQIAVLANGNFVVGSPEWSSTTATNVGAVTRVNGSTGLSGAVSANNSLVGSTAGDEISSNAGVIVLPGGNYLVLSSSWSNGAVAAAGAITWVNGNTGMNGAVSASNSLVGSHANDQVGLGDDVPPRVTILTNGNVVVTSLFWANGSIANAGAASWINAATGNHGVLSSTNSLVGSTAGDEVGWSGVVALTNNNYVVSSPLWNNGAATSAGAATWGSGSSGKSGVVSSGNSLVGTKNGDQVSMLGQNLSRGVTALTNGNYVVSSQTWSNGSATSAGAVTWANGASGLSGAVTTSNSLVGTHSNDGVGYGVSALSNGNYVVASKDWNDSEGAATWADGTTGLAGTVGSGNSLTGSVGGGTTAGDRVGFFVTALTNGNYVVGSPYWNSEVGAVTWVDGSAAHSATVSTSNSLIGAVVGDHLSSRGIVALTNGNYVVDSDEWNNGLRTNVGAVTWASGTTELSGSISAANSLIGSSDGDDVGNSGIFPLATGNYVVSSIYWNGTAPMAGAATWGSGLHGVSGAVSAANSLVGSMDNDMLGFDRILALSNGNYLVISFVWDNGPITDAGAVTEGRANGGTLGVLSPANSVIGTAQFGGTGMSYDYDATHDLVVVGQPLSNVVSLFHSDSIFENGFE